MSVHFIYMKKIEGMGDSLFFAGAPAIPLGEFDQVKNSTMGFVCDEFFRINNRLNGIELVFKMPGK